MPYFLSFILVLTVIVFVHEFGHFWVARLNGVKVEIFSIGFGKPILTWERDGVKWHICILPFGLRDGNIIYKYLQKTTNEGSNN